MTEFAVWIFLVIRMLIGAFEALAVTRFVFSVQKININTKKRIKYSLVLTVLAAIGNLLNFPRFVICGISIIYLFLISSKNRSIIKRISASLIAVLIALEAWVASSVLVLNMLMSGFDSETHTQLANTVTIPQKIVEALLLWLTFDMIGKLSDRVKVRLRKRNLIQMLTIFGCSVLSIALVNYIIWVDIINAAIGLLIEIPIMISTVTGFYMTLSVGGFHREHEELELYKQQYEFQRKADENIKRQYDEIRTIRHDLKQIYAVLLTLLEENKIEEAIEYLNKNRREIDKLEILIDVGNDFVNAILNAKLSRARALGIEVRCRADKALTFYNENASDMCMLLGNMLDNALEACEKCGAERKYIEIEIAAHNEQCLITVINSVERDILGENSALETTKPDPELHGFGVRSIKQIADKYDGNVRYFQEDGLFVCEVLLLK